MWPISIVHLPRGVNIFPSELRAIRKSCALNSIVNSFLSLTSSNLIRSNQRNDLIGNPFSPESFGGCTYP